MESTTGNDPRAVPLFSSSRRISISSVKTQNPIRINVPHAVIH